MKSPKATQVKGSPVLQFSSEALLQQAIAGLLARLPEVIGVQILQGAQEYGKDIVFYGRGAFGESLPCACVVKNHRITGQVESSKGARTVFLQAQQAFDTPFFDGSGNAVSIQRVYIVTPAAIGQTTISSIAGQLRERTGQVVFISGNQLFDMFKRYWPDFIAEEASALERHLTATAHRLSDNPLVHVATLYNLGAIDKSAEHVYVQQDFVRRFPLLQVVSVSTQFLPSPNSLSGLWTKGEIREQRFRMRTLDQYLTTAYQWGYCTQDAVTGSLVHGRLAEFSQHLQSSFGEGLRRAYTPTRSSVPNVGADARVRLHEWQLLLRALRSLSKDVEQTFGPLYAASTTYNEFLNRTLTPSDLFREPDFLRVCSFADLFQVLPGLFIHAGGAREFVVPKESATSRDGALLMVGPAGFGKTSFCRWHALDDAARFRTGKSDIVPVYVPLHRLARGPIGSFEETFLSTPGESGLLPATEAPESRHIRLYLDGLDEIPDTRQARDLIKLLKDGFTSARISQVFLTSRDYIYHPWLTWICRLSLMGFGQQELKDLVDRWIPPDSADNAVFFKELGASKSLIALTRTPLLATLIVLVFRQTGRLPENEVRLYETFTDLLSEGWNLAKRILNMSKFGPQVKKAILRMIARRTHERRAREFQWKDVRNAIRACITIGPEAVVDLADELVHDGIIVRSGTVYEFAHLSFQEYLTAKDYHGDPAQTGIRKALREFLAGDKWWYQVLRFYIGMSGNPKAVSNWLLDQSVRFHNRYGQELQKNTDRSDGGESADDRLKELEGVIEELYPGMQT